MGWGAKKFFKNKKVCIFGGGDSALDWAIELSKFAEITLVHRRKEFRAAPDSVNKMLNLEKEGKIKFLADSEAIITRGIIAILLTIFNNRTPNEIIESDTNFIEKIGLKEHLSPNRANGLYSMIKQIKFYAIAFSKK